MSWIQEGSISRRLTWINMLVSGFALLMACCSFVGYDLITFRQGTIRNLSTQAQIIGANSASALLFDDSQSAERTLSVLRSAPEVVSAAIYSADGQQFALYKRDQGSTIEGLPKIPPDKSESYGFAKGDINLSRLIVFQGKPIGTVYIKSDLQTLYSRLEGYAEIAAIVLAASLIAAFTISWPFQRTISKPVADLAEVARVVSREQNYSVRAMAAESSGELAILIQAFNEMLTQIQQRDAALQAAQADLERRVDDRTTQLAAANKELEAFSYSVSHDLRAPLRSIDGFSQALLEDCGEQLDAEGKNHLHRVRAATQRMAVLIDDLLNLSRVTRTEMRKEQVDLSALAISIVRELQEEQPSRRVQSVIAEGLVVEGDSQLLRVVMENLLSNAWKYTSGHECARLEFGKHQNGGRPTYFVRDDGAGFDPAYAHRLFGAFQRLHAMTEFQGTGVGLATVQRIIRRHGGEIWAEGAVEKGATFYFTL
jgi:signal transduction histidine kinase